MKILLEEYGRVILYFIIGITIVGVLIVVVQQWYQESYPELQQGSGIVIEDTETSLILLVENIEIELQENRENVDFSTYARAYEDAELSTELEVIVYGEEQVDVMTKGIYQLVYETTGSTGESFSKRVPVLVY